jgi:hypothetical protein
MVPSPFARGACGSVTMKTLLAGLLWIAIAGVAVHVAAQTMPEATTLSMRGTLEGYDSATRILSVTTRSGIVSLIVVPATRIRQGRHEIDVTALEKLNGYRAVVRYSESAGKRILQSIHVVENKDGR